MSFYVNFTVPSLEQQVKLQEVDLKTFKTINKFLINKNNTHINEYFNETLYKSLVEKDVFSKLTNFDKFCALFLLRCTSVSPDAEFKENVINVKKPLLPFLSSCLDLKVPFLKTIYSGELEIHLSLPKNLYFTDVFDAYFSSITKILLKNRPIELNENNKQDIIDNLPAEITGMIKEYSENINKSFSSLVFDVLSTKEDSSAVVLSPFNLSLFEILKALYTTDLKSIYELQYVLVSKLRYSAEYIDNNTLVDNLIIFSIYQQEIERANKEQAKIDKNIPLNK